MRLCFSCVTVLHFGAALTFPIDQRAKAVKGEQLEISQTLRVCRANLHFKRCKGCTCSLVLEFRSCWLTGGWGIYVSLQGGCIFSGHRVNGSVEFSHFCQPRVFAIYWQFVVTCCDTYISTRSQCRQTRQCRVGGILISKWEVGIPLGPLGPCSYGCP